MKALVTIDIQETAREFTVTMHFHKKIVTFKVDSLSRAMQRCEAEIKLHREKDVNKSQNLDKDSERG